jgi:hypothetical protein
MGNRLALAPRRWHIGHRCCSDAGGVHIVTCQLDPNGLPVIVTPTRPGFAAAARLADALNRAYAIEPASGFDVSAILGLGFVGMREVESPNGAADVERAIAQTAAVDRVAPIF